MVLEAGGHDPEERTELDFYPRPPSFLEMLTRGLSPLLQVGSPPFPVLPILRTPQALELPLELLDLLQLAYDNSVMEY